MKKVIFVGMHNKENKMPLCPSTKTGKLINQIIHKITPELFSQRTNLYDIDYYPSSLNESKFELALDWHERIQPTEDDIIVLLGAEVHENFIQKSLTKIIKVAHPASKRSHIEMNEYIKRVSNLINHEFHK